MQKHFEHPSKKVTIGIYFVNCLKDVFLFHISIFHVNAQQLPNIYMVSTLQHAYRDGQLEEAVLHHLEPEDGSTAVDKDTRSFSPLFSPFSTIFLFYFSLSANCDACRLSDFLRNLQIR